MTAEKVKILVVDDHEIVRKGVCALLSMQPDFDVVCDVADGVTAVEKAAEFLPDVVIMDISMPGIDGLEAARRIKKVLPEIAIVFLSQHASAEMVKQAVKAGGNGYVTKSEIVKDLIAAIRRAIEKKISAQAIPPQNSPSLPDWQA